MILNWEINNLLLDIGKDFNEYLVIGRYMVVLKLIDGYYYFEVDQAYLDRSYENVHRLFEFDHPRDNPPWRVFFSTVWILKVLGLKTKSTKLGIQLIYQYDNQMVEVYGIQDTSSSWSSITNRPRQLDKWEEKIINITTKF